MTLQQAKRLFLGIFTAALAVMLAMLIVGFMFEGSGVVVGYLYQHCL